MLDERGLEAIFDQIGVPSLGRALVRKARKEAPVREVRARGGNVLTFYQSMKMGRTVGTESRHLEFAAAVGHEFDAEVIEYFPQPCQLRFEVIDDDGEVHKIDHTPDFLVVTETGIWLEEWKSHERMESLARKLPWRYRRESEEQWNAPLIADWLGKRGIGYRIRTERNIPARRIENLLMLEDYLLPEAPACSDEVASAVKNALVEEGAMTLADLFERAPCSAEEAFKLIADGLLVADLDNLPLEDSRSFRVYRSIAVREFERGA